MPKHDDGGPAFSNSNNNGYQRGMSYHQWLVGMIANGLVQAASTSVTKIIPRQTVMKDVAVACHEQADAIIAEQRRRENK